MEYPKLKIDRDAILELSNLDDGVFSPLTGFMAESDYHSVVDNMHLKNGAPWTIPVTLEIPEIQLDVISRSEKIILVNERGDSLAELSVSDVYKIDVATDVTKIFGTSDEKHPGVKKELSRSAFRVGGDVQLLSSPENLFPKYAFTPAQTRAHFKKMGWKTIAGFQTRNPIHRAHEYLQRVALEITDGLFVHPLIGWKKSGDVTPEAVLAAYQIMVDQFYPKNTVLLGCLQTPMRYAGPREAVFHAIIRRNYGCTHFIVGRDHAGVGNFYEKYAAHRLVREFNDLGIEILTLCGPYFCKKCASVVTEKTCPHGEKYAISVSGTEMRALMSRGEIPPPDYMRPEIAATLLELHRQNRLFIE